MLDLIQAYTGKGHPDAPRRLEICLKCPLKMKIVDICTVCGCPVSKKVKSKKKICPKWRQLNPS